MCQSPIANIDISKEYDESLGTDDVHYQSFARMAAFFGRDMQAHRHDQYFQMHFLDTGQIELQLDDHRYSVQAPLFVLTPPSVPHAFITESDSDGHVLTVREDLIWPLLEVLYPGTREAFGLPGICLSLADRPEELAALARKQGLATIQTRRFGASEDAGFLMERVQKQGGEAAYLILGADLAAPHHHNEFDFDERVMQSGVELLAAWARADVDRIRHRRIRAWRRSYTKPRHFHAAIRSVQPVTPAPDTRR